jgi:hypothetical protein
MRMNENIRLVHKQRQSERMIIGDHEMHLIILRLRLRLRLQQTDSTYS